MNSLFVSALLVALVAANLPESEIFRPDDLSHINDPAHIAFLNSDPNATWTAGHNERFAGLSYFETRGLLGAQLSHISEHLHAVKPDSHYASIDSVPAEFSAVDNWKGLIHPIRDQERCGSCWAFSASEVLSDREAIASGKPSPVLSVEDMVSCDTSDHGCSGGALPLAWNYLTSSGITTDSCMPYTAGNGTAPTCSSKCADGSRLKRYKASSSYAINGAANMQKEIMTNGPVQVAFLVYKSFMSYKSGVYQKKWYELLPEGGHAVKVVGWGTENKVDYWLVANSWNTVWGLEGYFKIARGKDACGIESMGPPYAGMAAKN